MTIGAIVKSFILTFLLLAGLSGCADNAYSLCCTEDYSVGDEESVTVYGTWNSISARSMAEEHCKKHSRSAKFNQTKTGPWNLVGNYPDGKVFDCLK